MEKNIEYVGEEIDRLVTLDVRARGAIYTLYDAARKLAGNALTLTAARKIAEVSKDNGTAIVTTGFIVLPQRVQETDGPLGAAALARCLNAAFGVNPIIVVEEQSNDIMASTLRALGVTARIDENKYETCASDSTLILNFPLVLDEAIETAKEVLDRYRPSVIISIEKAGSNISGHYHTMRGMNVSSFHAKIEPLIEEARSRNLLTVGIGDGGNEVGMGNIFDTVQRSVPYGRSCQCPCKRGIAAHSKVDFLVTASISNWGAYGIEACIAALSGKRGVLHTPEEEERMLISAIGSGAVDGVTGKSEPSVDAVSKGVHSSIIRIFEEIVQREARKKPSETSFGPRTFLRLQ